MSSDVSIPKQVVRALRGAFPGIPQGSAWDFYTKFKAILDDVQDLKDGAYGTPGSVNASILADNAVTTAKILDANVTTAKIALLGVTTAVLNDLAVTAGKLAADAVTTVKILDANVTTAKMALLSVTTAVLNDLAVTAGKLAAAVSARIGGTHTLAVGVEGANAIAVTIQLKDIAGTNLAAKTQFRWWLSDTAGAAPTATGPSTSTVVSVGVALETVTAKIQGVAITDANGACTLTLTEAGVATWFVNIATSDGKVFSSAAATFA